MNLKKQAADLITDLRTHWDKPPEGKKLNYKEIAAYSIGGMGASGNAVLATHVSVGANIFCLEALKFNQDQIAILSVVATIIGILRAPLVAWLIDNTNSKRGKFRPWILYMTLPICLLLFATAWTPVALSPTFVFFYIMVTNNLLGTFQQLYGSGFGGLPTVMTQNSDERSVLYSVGSFIYSLGPSIVNALFPVLIGVLSKTEGGYVLAFRVSVPIFAVLFCGLGLLCMKTKERIIQPKEHKRKVPFIWGIKQVFRNGPLWLNTFSGVLGVFKLGVLGITGFIAAYQLENYAMQGLFATIIGTASVPGMLLAPLFIKKFGKRNLTILSNFVFLGIISLFFIIGFEHVVVSIVLIYIATLIQGVTVVTAPAMGADINDYQQYISGERMEGFMGMITGYLTTVATALVPVLSAALNKSIGFYSGDDLRNHSILIASFKLNLVLSVISCIACTVPFFFYKLTEKRHAEVVLILEERANEVDRQNGLEASYEVDPAAVNEAEKALDVSSSDKQDETPPSDQ